MRREVKHPRRFHFLRRIVAMLCSSSVRFAAATIGSTCSGRRKPAMAPFTAEGSPCRRGVIPGRAAPCRPPHGDRAVEPAAELIRMKIEKLPPECEFLEFLEEAEDGGVSRVDPDAVVDDAGVDLFPAVARGQSAFEARDAEIRRAAEMADAD